MPNGPNGALREIVGMLFAPVGIKLSRLNAF